MTLRLLVAVALFALGSGIAVGQAPNEWILRAVKAQENGEPDKALEFADKAIAADPNAKLGYLFRSRPPRSRIPAPDRIASQGGGSRDYDGGVADRSEGRRRSAVARLRESFKLAKCSTRRSPDFDAFLVERPRGSQAASGSAAFSLYYAGKVR